MTTNWNSDKTKNVMNDFGTQFSDTIYSSTLAAATNTAVTVPSKAAIGAVTASTYNKFMAVCTSDGTADVYIALNQAAAVPAGAPFAATSSELMPGNQHYGKMVKSGDTINFISPGTPNVTVAFYAIQE